MKIEKMKLVCDGVLEILAFFSLPTNQQTHILGSKMTLCYFLTPTLTEKFRRFAKMTCNVIK